MIEQRKTRRFDLRLPFELTRVRSDRTTFVTETKNVSSVGALFLAESGFDVGDPIEYVITLPTGRDGNTVKIRCLGKVVRVMEHEVGTTLERYVFLRTNKPADESAVSLSSGPKSVPYRKGAGS